MYIYMQMYVRSRCGAYDTTSYATGECRNKLESLYTGGGGLTAATGKCVDDGSILLILTNEREFNKPKT